MNTYLIQKKIIKQINNYNKSISKKIDPSLSPYSYMTPWAETHGFYQLQKILKRKDGFNSILFFIKDLLVISKNMNCLKLAGDTKKLQNRNYKTLIISYCQKSSFRKGIFYDQYFNFSSENKNFLWLLISLDNYLPKEKSKNIFIYYNKKSEKRFFILNYLIECFFKKRYNFNSFFHWNNSYFFFSESIKKVVNKILKATNIKKTILNYEGIPYQHGIINQIKSNNKNIKIFCYLHCAGWPLQTDLLYRNRKIDKLYVSGFDQKKNLINHLSWPKKKIVNIPSLRFSKNFKSDFGGQIFIPFKVSDAELISLKLKKFLGNAEDKSLNFFKLRIHPLNQRSKKHIDLKNKLLKILDIYKKKFSKKKKNTISIVFGSVTGITVQALESGVEIIHFPIDFNIDVFNEIMWPNIKVENYYSDVLRYSLKKKNKTFWVKNTKPKFQKYFGEIS